MVELLESGVCVGAAEDSLALIEYVRPEARRSGPRTARVGIGCYFAPPDDDAVDDVALDPALAGISDVGAHDVFAIGTLQLDVAAGDLDDRLELGRLTPFIFPGDGDDGEADRVEILLEV